MPVNRCSLVSEAIGNPPEPVDTYSQKRDLKQTKVLYPQYKTIYADVQQENILRLGKAWDRWRKPDKTGKRGGRPRFKKRGDICSITFPRVNCPKAGARLQDSVLKLSGIGEMGVIQHRPIPDGFAIKTVTLKRLADGWYASFSCQDDSVPSSIPVDAMKSATGIDVGLEKFLTTAQGQVVEVPQFYRQAQQRRTRQQRKLKNKQPGSANWQRQQNKVARLELHVSRQRREFHYQVAHKLCDDYDLIAFETLNIRGLARTVLGKAILDCGWRGFLDVLQAVAVKRGKHTVGVSAYGTSQECCGCGVKVPKGLAERWHSCPHCGLSMDRDQNAAVNILNRAVGQPLAGCGGLSVGMPVKQQTLVVKSEAPVRASA